MLKATIVYLPGSGGAFLYRTLTLSEHTAFADSRTELNYNRLVASSERITNYSVWTSDHWKQGETQWSPAYKTQPVEFIQFELTDNWIIDLWHPAEFLTHDERGLAWEPGAWPNLIFIQVNDTHKDFLLNNQSTKQYQLDWTAEMTAYNKLKDRYADRGLYIDFDAFFDPTAYVQAVQAIDQRLELNLNFDYVKQLWQSWYDQSKKVWR